MKPLRSGTFVTLSSYGKKLNSFADRIGDVGITIGDPDIGSLCESLTDCYGTYTVVWSSDLSKISAQYIRKDLKVFKRI